MNICFIKGKIITEPEYKFTFIRNADAVIMFEIELENKSKIKVIGYNEIADKCYKELEKEDIIWIEGRIEEKQIVIKELVKNQRELANYKGDKILELISYLTFKPPEL